MSSTPILSFMGANLVAQQLDWSMTSIKEWSRGDQAANAFYEPIETFGPRFAAYVDLVVGAGFAALDVWTAQLNWKWASAEHIATARGILDERSVRCISYAGSFGTTAQEFQRAVDVITGLGGRILGGNTAAIDDDRATVLDILERTDTVLGLENHPERTSAEILERVGDGASGRVGVAVDTGWWGTNDANVPDVIRELAGHVSYVHLKDVSARGSHDCCVFGTGVVDIAGCVEALDEIGYLGPLSLEHEPPGRDPVPEVIENKRLIEALLG